MVGLNWTNGVRFKLRTKVPKPETEKIPEFYAAPYGRRPLMSTGMMVPICSPLPAARERHRRRCLDIAYSMEKDEAIGFDQLKQHLRWSGYPHPAIRAAYEAAIENAKDQDKASLMHWFNTFY